MFQELNKVTGGKPRATRRSSGGRRVILKALKKSQKCFQKVFLKARLHGRVLERF